MPEPRPKPFHVESLEVPGSARVTEGNAPVAPKQSFGLRADGTAKGDGFLGPLRRADGDVSSEISIGVNIDGNEVEIPTLVPTLSESEKQWLLTNDVENNPQSIPKPIVDKAVAHARQRIAAGKSPFAEQGESPRAVLKQVQRPAPMHAEGATVPGSVRVTGRPAPSDIALPTERPAQPVRRTLSPEGAEALKQREGGFVAEAYDDAGGLAIGYGMQRWKGKPVTRDLKITQEEADAEFERQYREDKGPIVDNNLKVPVTQQQYDALVSIAWNLPAAALALIAKLNRGEQLTAEDFQTYTNSRSGPGTRATPNEGLQRRRGGEFEQFNTPAPAARDASPRPPPAAPKRPTGVHAESFEVHGSTKVTSPAKATWMQRAQDVGTALLRGVIGVDEAASGINALLFGEKPRSVPKDINLDVQGDRQSYASTAAAVKDVVGKAGYSEAYQAEAAAVDAARGPVEIAKAALKNPAVIVNTVVESLPLMVAGGVAGRAVGLAGVAPSWTGAIGEGIASAGATAESVRQGNDDGQLTPTQAAIAAATGAGTAGLGRLGGWLARKFKIADVDDMLAGAAVDAVARRNLVTATIFGAIQEGLFEELPQSVQEQILTNFASGKTLLEGVDQAAVLGALSGGVMGAGGQVLERGPDAARDLANRARTRGAAQPAAPSPAPSAPPSATVESPGPPPLGTAPAGGAAPAGGSSATPLYDRAKAAGVQPGRISQIQRERGVGFMEASRLAIEEAEARSGISTSPEVEKPEGEPTDVNGRPLGGYAGPERREAAGESPTGEERRTDYDRVRAKYEAGELQPSAEAQAAFQEKQRVEGVRKAAEPAPGSPASFRANADKLEAAGQTLAARDYRRIADEIEAKEAAAAAKPVDVSPPAPEREEHTYSSTQVNLPQGLADAVVSMARSIPDEEVAEDGRAGDSQGTQPHVTVKYGLESDDVDDIRKALADQGPITVTLGKTSSSRTLCSETASGNQRGGLRTTHSQQKS